jgi:predicted membrane protein
MSWDDEERRTRSVGGVKVTIDGRHGVQHHEHGGLFVGLILILIGTAFLLDHLGVLPVGQVYRFWPLILVLFGISNFFSYANRGFGIFLVVAGAVLQLKTLGLIHITFAELWPLAIIGVGFLVLWGALRAPRVRVEIPGDITDALSATAIFGGVERRITAQDFKGGNATAIFGGIELDLRDAQIEGNEAVIVIDCIFGGVEIRVPDSWEVRSSGLPVFGGYSDKTRRSAASSSPQNTPAKILTLAGTVIFGGVEVKN